MPPAYCPQRQPLPEPDVNLDPLLEGQPSRSLVPHLFADDAAERLHDYPDGALGQVDRIGYLSVGRSLGHELVDLTAFLQG
jgi:hypothetical protein